MIPEWKIYPRSQGHSTVYLQNVVTDPAIQVGAYTIYDDFVNDPRDFQRNNVLYHYPECNHVRLIIGKYSSIAYLQCGQPYAEQPLYLPVPHHVRGMGPGDGVRGHCRRLG